MKKVHGISNSIVFTSGCGAALSTSPVHNPSTVYSNRLDNTGLVPNHAKFLMTVILLSFRDNLN